MLKVPPRTKIFFCLEATDMRRSFDKLSAMVKELLAQDPQSGHMFIFRNRAGDRIKVLHWDGKGYCLWYKRLDRGTFVIPPGLKSNFQLPKPKLEKLLEGMIPLGRLSKRKWHL